MHTLCTQWCPLFATPWTVACQVSLARRFPRQEDWSGVSFPHLGDLPDPGIELVSLASLALSGRFFTTSATWKPDLCVIDIQYRDLQF